MEVNVDCLNLLLFITTIHPTMEALITQDRKPICIRRFSMFLLGKSEAASEANQKCV